jgi:hypothetical protein
VLNYKVGDVVRIRSQEWLNSQKKCANGVIPLNKDTIFARAFTNDMLQYAGKETWIAYVREEHNGYGLEIDCGKWIWEDWMLDPDYSSFGEPFSTEDAIIAMVKYKETLYNKKGDLKYLWTGKSFISVDASTGRGASYFETFGDEFYRCPEKPKRAWTRWEVLDWANSEESRGWVVRKKGSKQWYSPQFFCYDDGADKYKRARILPDKSGIDESTIQGFKSEMKIEESGK